MSLDAEFNQVVHQINTKIEEAAKLIREASELGEKIGLPCLYIVGGYYDDYDVSEEDREKISEINFRPLMRELDSVGWSTSSMGC